MPSLVKAILFDCDGTLIDSEYAHYEAWNSALNAFGASISLEEYCQYMGSPALLIARLFAAKIGKDCAEILLQTKKNHFRARMEKGLPPIETTVNFLKLLAKEKQLLGFKIGVCSAAKRKDIFSHLHHLEITSLIDIVLSGQDDLSEYIDPEGVNKPKPYIYLHAMKLLGISPKETVVIEDSASGAKAGLLAGCFTIAIPNPYTKNHVFGPVDLYVESFKEMTAREFFHKIGASYDVFSL